MKKLKFPSEIAYIVGLAILSLGTCLMEKANFGLSMIAAPAYLLSKLLTKTVSSFFTFGRCEIMLEAIVVTILCLIIRKFKIGYLFSLLSGIIYGLTLDVWIYLFRNFEAAAFDIRLIYFLLGQAATAFGVALQFKSYFPPAAYDFFVKEASKHFNISVPKFKTGFDIVFVIISITLSFAIFGIGHFEGIKLGTVVVALVNGTTIGLATQVIDRLLSFFDLLKLKKLFE